MGMLGLSLIGVACSRGRILYLWSTLYRRVYTALSVGATVVAQKLHVCSNL
jgi:hypothetical protein